MGLASAMSAFSVTKLFSGIFTGDYWGKLIAFGLGFIVLGFIGFAVYKAYVKKPEPTTNQRAETIVNYNHAPRITFGCASWKTYVDYPVNSVR